MSPPPPSTSSSLEELPTRAIVDDPSNGSIDPANRISFDDDPQASVPRLQIGRYVVLEQVGAGGMGVVYRAYDPKLSREVALKLIFATRADVAQSEASARLFREAQAMAQLSHPNVLPVFDVEATEHELFLTMEFIPGQDVRTWLRAQKRSWSEVLRVFREAGAGLQAAHAAGIVHRDFKPANVLIDGRDGRVRVTDFGLARASTDSTVTGEVPTPLVANSPPGTSSVLDSPLTMAGTMLGTPAYMAPELLEGDPADSLSDQFSFCVALYEALYRVRPPRPATLRSSNDSSPTLRRHPEAAVPSWLANIVLRGLEADPHQRYPDMKALLAELQRDPSRRRRRAAMVFGLVCLGAATVAVPTLATNKPTCARDEQALARVWDVSRQQRIALALRGAPDETAKSTWDRVSTLVDQYTAEWLDASVAACEATHVRHEQSDRMFDRRTSCLDRRRTELDRTLEVIESQPAATLDRAVEMVATLRRVANCNDRSYLEAQVTPPDDPQTSAAVDHVRSDLARVEALAAAGQLASGLQAVAPLIETSRELRYPPLVAEVLLARGELERLSGDRDKAIDFLKDAYFVALQSGHHQAAVAASTAVIFAEGQLRQRPDVALEWSRHAEAVLAQAGHDPIAEALLQERIGLAHATARHFDEAERRLTRALELRERALGAEHLLVGNSHLNLGWQLGLRGELEACAEETETALEIWQANLGDHNPRLLPPVTNLAAELTQLGRFDEALEHVDWALALLDRADSAMGYMGGFAHANAAISLQALGRDEEALAHFRLAQTQLAASIGPHSTHAITLSKHAELLAKRSQHDQAKNLFEQAIAMFEQTAPADDADALAAKFQLARLLWETSPSDRERALVLARAAFAGASTVGHDALRESIVGWFGEHALGSPDS